MQLQLRVTEHVACSQATYLLLHSRLGRIKRVATHRSITSVSCCQRLLSKGSPSKLQTPAA